VPTNEEIASFLTERLEARLSRVKDVTVPVFLEGRYPTAIGSAVLLEIGGEHFAITAGHVTDWRTRGTMYLGGGEHPIVLDGSLTTTVHPSGKRKADKLDVSVIRLADETTGALQVHNFLRWSEIYGRLEAPPDEYFITAGFPVTRQRIILDPPGVETSIYAFLAVSRDFPEYDSQKYDPLQNILLKFTKKKMWRRDKGRVTAPDLYGMSGCGIWWAEGYKAPELGLPQLAAIGIEWHVGKRPQVLGTRIAVILAAIAKHRPHLLEHIV
jgi:hypothetical protein